MCIWKKPNHKSDHLLKLKIWKIGVHVIFIVLTLVRSGVVWQMVAHTTAASWCGACAARHWWVVALALYRTPWGQLAALRCLDPNSPKARSSAQTNVKSITTCISTTTKGGSYGTTLKRVTWSVPFNTEPQICVATWILRKRMSRSYPEQCRWTKMLLIDTSWWLFLWFAKQHSTGLIFPWSLLKNSMMNLEKTVHVYMCPYFLKSWWITQLQRIKITHRKNTMTKCGVPPTELQIRNALSPTTSDMKSRTWLAHVSNV